MPQPPHPDARVITPMLLRKWPLPAAEDDKESRGRMVVVGGGSETPGAILLAAEAALRAGGGKLQVVTGSRIAPHLALALPEALVRGIPDRSDGSLDAESAQLVLELASEADVVLIGPGLVGKESVRSLTTSIVTELRVPMVLDALSLAAVTDNHECVHHLAGNVVLTPNLSELAITLGWSRSQVEDDPAAAALELAKRSQTTVTAGGVRSAIASPEGEVWYDEGGGAGLGVSGSGDVKAGVVAGLLARRATPSQAAVWGTYLHGRAGDRLAADVGKLGYLAREVPAQIPRVLAELEA
ncbi:MAG: NAD(P)H-hydrate dehydratase [Nocardioidaceae bacterium]|nr:NAD(P)H-hydrate dehydratase [Nocardioidaceae bacterium]